MRTLTLVLRNVGVKLVDSPQKTTTATAAFNRELIYLNYKAHLALCGYIREQIYQNGQSRKINSTSICIRTNFRNHFLERGTCMLTVVAFDKSDGTPCAIAMFKKNTYDPSLMEPLPLLQIHRDISQTTRKTILELSYFILSIDKKGKCLADICIATGLEALHNQNLNERRQSTVNVWLQLAGFFKNTLALGIYLSYGFEVVAMYLGSVLMIL